MNKIELIERMSEYDYFPTKKAAGDFLNDILDIITDTVAKGEDVRLAGFGKFEAFTRQNGDVTPKFRAFTDFKEKVTK